MFKKMAQSRLQKIMMWKQWFLLDTVWMLTKANSVNECIRLHQVTEAHFYRCSQEPPSRQRTIRSIEISLRNIIGRYILQDDNDCLEFTELGKRMWRNQDWT